MVKSQLSSKASKNLKAHSTHFHKMHELVHQEPQRENARLNIEMKQKKASQTLHWRILKQSIQHWNLVTSSQYRKNENCSNRNLIQACLFKLKLQLTNPSIQSKQKVQHNMMLQEVLIYHDSNHEVPSPQSQRFHFIQRKLTWVKHWET